MSQASFEELSQDVDWQIRSFLEQCKTFVDNSRSSTKNLSPTKAAAQNILDAYLALANQFYNEYKASLQETYEPAQKKRPKAIRSDAVPQLMQFALEKLTAEWDRVYRVIAALQTSESRAVKSITAPLTPVIQAALRDVGLSPRAVPVVVVLGQTYSLGFFNYLDNFRSLSVPLAASKSPWEWTIFWHEMAGERVRLFENARREFDEIIQTPRYATDAAALKQDLEELLDRYCNRLENDTPEQRVLFRANLKEKVDADRSSSQQRSYPQTRDLLQGMIMLSFDELLVDIMQGLDPAVQKTAWRVGWSADWLRELFEDSLSVRNFPLEFLTIFDRLLRRRPDGGKGLRHPPRAVRLAVAAAMKMQITAASDTGLPPRLTALTTFVKKTNLPSDVFPDSFDEIDLEIVWAVAKHLLELHGRMRLSATPIDQPLVDLLSQTMRDHLLGKGPGKIYDKFLADLKKLRPARLNRLSPGAQGKDYPLVNWLLKEALAPGSRLPAFIRLARLEFGYTDFDDIGSNAAAAESLSSGSGGTSNFNGVALWNTFTQVIASLF